MPRDRHRPVEGPTPGNQSGLQASTAITEDALTIPTEIHNHTNEPFMALAAIGNSNHPADLVAFHHAALFSPSLSTLERAIEKQYLPPLPGLTLATLRKYKPDLEATTMGHLDNVRKNTQSTKKRNKKPLSKEEPPSQLEDQDDAFPQQQVARSHHCYLTTSEPRQLVYTDQTGRFPIPSSAGNQYLLVAYDYDSNNILLRPIQNRTAESLTAAIQDVHDTLTHGGCQPKFHRMDNECPQLHHKRSFCLILAEMCN
jgi:hypothetical protein